MLMEKQKPKENKGKRTEDYWATYIVVCVDMDTVCIPFFDRFER